MLAVNSQGHVGTTGMQYEDGTTWRPSSAPEQPDFGTTAVPDHPGYLMPSPGALHTAFHKAVEELERSRGREPRRAGYAAKSQEAVFEAGLQAYCFASSVVNQTSSRAQLQPIGSSLGVSSLRFSDRFFPAKLSSVRSAP